MITCPIHYDPCIMATSLEEAWQNLSLTAEEQQVIIADGEDDNMTNELISLCLLRHLHTTLAFNPRAMKAVLRNVWKLSKGRVITDLDANLFVFQFFSATNRDFVLNEGPWAVEGSILLLQQMTSVEVPSEVEFHAARFWVKAYNVPELLEERKLYTTFKNKTQSSKA
ncbi:hypothetical protein Cgig2_003894 [Carnegiea gigantea]|uniref:DUF4283 domain-containing protein n=1 Tax=Carnegiea gigantea TaxID=171969 RepID=A0A9Q1JTH8_9CARY|nr:hypothetical protein Cgig2_003894 [Carnegiea gigantea]